VRQFFSLRYWLTLLALVGLAVGAAAVAESRRSDPDDPIGPPGAALSDRTIDLVTWVFAVQLPVGFEMVDGRTNMDLALLIDATRTMTITKGTPGEIDCPRLAELGQCTVAADLLGDGVLWFSIVPGVPGPTVELPAVSKLLDGGWVRLANGWVVPHAPVVDRNCPEDTASLTEFIGLYGEQATSTFDFDQQQIVKVTCPDTDGVVTTTTSNASTTTLDPAILDPTAPVNTGSEADTQAP
jgi:hypothetical protein